MGRLSRIIADSLAGLFTLLACLCMVYVPVRRLRANGDVVCLFEDGPHTLSFSEACSALTGIGEDGALLFEQDGKRGRIETGKAFAQAVDVLRRGPLSALFTLDMDAMNALERTAVMQVFGRDVYYADGAFRLMGEGLSLSETVAADRVVLLAGTLPRSYLKDVGATALHLSAGAELTADRLTGSKISQITADLPYVFEDGALYLGAAGGRRLVAAVPTAETLAVGECEYFDRGALCCCTRLVSLTLPFLGSLNGETGDSRSDLSYLFETSDGTPMPESLASVTVLGGKISAYAFYGCTLAEADLRRIPAEDLSPEAFTGASAMRIVCTRGDLVLSGYRVSAQGGLYTYEMEDV